MKIKNLNLSLFLLFIVVFFSVMGSFEKEAFEDKQKPIAVPECIGGCDKDDNYILKSQIVPPVCPSFPPYLYKNDKEDNKEDDKEDDKVKNVVKNKKNIFDRYTKNIFDKNIEEEIVKNNRSNTPMEVNKELVNNKSGKNLWDSFKGMGDNVGLSNSDGNELKKNSGMILNNKDINIDNTEIENLKQELKKLRDKSNYDGSCPPCPACERCPEPSFECKKVPNYRSNSVGQYLPLPVLNDFSRF